MKTSSSMLVAALALTALQSQAADVSFEATVGVPGTYTAPEFTTADPALAFEFTGSTGISLSPLFVTGPYLSIQTGGSATVDLDDVSAYSFIWGSPDRFNFVDIVTSGEDYTFSGVDLGALLGFTAGGSNANTSLFTVTAASGITIDSITFRSNGIAFELAEAVTAVPENHTYALMLGGLTVMGFLARRRRPD